MGVVTALARTGVRRRKAALAGLAVVVTTGLGVSLAAMEAAVRTERAYPEYLRRANVAELVVNPGLATARVEEILAATPGIASFTSDDLINATVDEGAPRTQRQVDSSTIQLRMSENGRYTAQDRPVVHQGRMVRDGAAEAFLSEETAADLGAGVGDEIPLAFWRPSFNTPGVGPSQEDTVAPVGRAVARVVGVGLFADEVLAEDLYARRRLVVSADVAAPFTCDLTPPGAGDQRDAVELLPTVMPDSCALAYRYFSLQLAGGDAGVDQVVDRLRTAFDEENQQLPPALRELDVGYTVIPSATRDQRQRLDRSLRPIIHGLELFAVAAGLSTVVVAGMSALRMARRDETARTIWRQLGVDRRQRFMALAMPLALAVAAGVAGAMAVGFGLSRLGPVASARAVVSRPALGLTGRTVLLVALPASLLLVAAVAAAALVVASRRLESTAGRGSLISGFSSLVHPARGLGMRAAARGPGSIAVLAGAVVAVAMVLASLVFSGSVNRLVTQPARYGWPYDAGVMVGYGYGGADADAVSRTLDRADVTAWGLADLAALTIKGQSVPAIAARRNFSSLPIAVVGGRAPAADDEVALGVKSAAELGVGVGDKVALAGSFGRRSAVVTGTVILPALGPIESGRAATGTGALLSERFYDAWVAGYEKASGIPAGGLASQNDGSFIGIELADGVDPAAFLAAISRQLTSWDRNGFDSFTYPAPVRPSVITDVASMRRVPMALGGFLALSMATGLAVAIAVATRGRRRELALLGALGCQPGQRAASVRWHALTIVGIAVVVGTPLGIALGRTEYRAFAGDLGVAGDALVSLAWTAGVVVLTTGVGFLAAAGPARATAKLRPAEVLGDQ